MKRKSAKHGAGWSWAAQEKPKRDPVFCRDLAREWGMEAAPEAYRSALREIYEELPDELPVTRHPLRSALRGLTVAAAAVALVCASLFGVNAMNPELTESLPGIGQMFRAVNGTEETPPPKALPTAEPQPEESGPAGPSSMPEEVTAPEPEVNGFPEFTPVAIASKTGLNGTLTVENAYSDGVCVYLTLRLETQEEELKRCSWVSYSLSDMFRGETDLVQVNGSHTGWKKNRDYAFYRDDQGVYRTEWVVDLPEKLSQDEELSVSLNLTHLAGYPEVWDEETSRWTTAEDQTVETECGFQSEFSIRANTSYNFELSSGAEDNGVKLLNAECSPSYFSAEMELPFLGRDSYYLFDGISGPYHNGCYFPIGCNPILKTEDGTVLKREENLGDSSEYSGLAPDGPLHGTWVYQGPPPGTKSLILTFYDDTTAFSGMIADSLPPYSWNRVTAEFTIDLESGTAFPSENYRREGFEKLDPQAYLQEPRHGGFTNGFYPARTYFTSIFMGEAAPSPWKGVHQVTVYGEDTEYRPVELRCYLGRRELAATLRSHPPEEFNAVEEGMPDTATYYQDENGAYWEGTTNPQITQKPLRVMSFRVDYPESVFHGEDGTVEEKFYLELVDSETGEVLLEDVDQIFAQEFVQVFGEEYLEEAGVGEP